MKLLPIQLPMMFLLLLLMLLLLLPSWGSMKQ